MIRKLLISVFPFLVLTIAYIISNSDVNPITGKAQLKADIECEGIFLQIRNSNNYEWTDVHIYLNDEYLLLVPIIYPRDVIVALLRDFKKANGTSFDPKKMKPEEIFIKAKTQRGEGTLKRFLTHRNPIPIKNHN
ncbi:hypothetical protein H5T89_10520 [bacterium]|nr:hypothetical protein [bacterium]